MRCLWFCVRKKDRIITEVLNDRIECPSGTLFMWAQDMNQAQLEWACSSLTSYESYFHTTLQTGRQPVTPDDNDKLRMVVFNDSYEWKVYGYVLFGASVDNGGLYLEGDPSTPGDQATFFAYEDVPERPIFDIWNLRHEYIHYLDGRFITQGDFQDVNGAGRTVWYGEGIAEYISRKNCNNDAANEAATGTYALSKIFENEYGVGQTRIYPWGYLATRFMFERYPSEFISMMNLFKQGKYQDYRNTLVDNWVGNKTYDTQFASWLTDVQSTGCTIDTTRPPSPVEPVNVDDVQGADQIGINKCSTADPVNVRRMEAGEAVCLEAVTGANQMQSSILVPDGLVDVTLQITLRHGSGNAKLLHRYDGRPSDTLYDHISNGPGTNETILINPVKPGWNYVHMRADDDFSGVTLLARYIQNGTSSDIENACATKAETNYVELASGEAVCVRENTRQNGRMDFYFYSDDGAKNVTIETSHGTGNADIYHKYGQWPTRDNYDNISANSDNKEKILISAPRKGWHQIIITGVHQGMTLRMSAE